MIELFQNGAFQASEQFLSFTGARHQVLTNNIANISTPYFQPADMNPQTFQSQLRQAIDRRRASDSALTGPLYSEAPFARGETVAAGVAVRPIDENLMFHDRNNRDLDRMMQTLAENTMAHQTAIELLRNQMDMLKTAIRERL